LHPGTAVLVPEDPGIRVVELYVAQSPLAPEIVLVSSVQGDYLSRGHPLAAHQQDLGGGDAQGPLIRRRLSGHKVGVGTNSARGRASPRLVARTVP